MGPNLELVPGFADPAFLETLCKKIFRNTSHGAQIILGQNFLAGFGSEYCTMYIYI